MKAMFRMMVVAALVAVIVTPAADAGVTWEIGEDGSATLSFLGQIHGSYNEETDIEDIYLRRGRLILSGQITDGVKFFMETDNDGAGRRGTSGVSTDIQDAFIDLQLFGSDHWVEAGLILLPFSFETRASAASLLGLDYNSETVKFVNTFVWRDYGAMLHGSFLDDRMSYCIGGFDGYDDANGNKNADASLRMTGHVAVNVIGKAETGWFYSQNRLGNKGSYVSLGLGADVQKDATARTVEIEGAPAVTTIDDSEAWVVDLQSGFDLGAVNVTLNGALYDWDNANFKGNTAFVETGVLYGKTMVTGKCSLQDPDAGDETVDYTAGIHYFLKGHNARGGIEYRWGDSDGMALIGLQFLL